MKGTFHSPFLFTKKLFKWHMLSIAGIFVILILIFVLRYYRIFTSAVTIASLIIGFLSLAYYGLHAIYYSRIMRKTHQSISQSLEIHVKKRKIWKSVFEKISLGSLIVILLGIFAFKNNAWIFIGSIALVFCMIQFVMELIFIWLIEENLYLSKKYGHGKEGD